MGKLDGQVALITGGTKGIGEAAVRLFVRLAVGSCGRLPLSPAALDVRYAADLGRHPHGL